MAEIMEFLREFNIYSVVIRIVCAFLLGGAIGFERERNGHAAGFRTHILVCIGAAMVVLTGFFSVEVLRFSSDPLRMAAQVVSGIGFIGAGTIMVTHAHNVRGLTTAAGLWSTAAIGLATGAGFYEGALICTLIMIIVMSRFKSFDKLISAGKSSFTVYFEINGLDNTNEVLENLKGNGISLRNIDVKAPKSSASGNIGIEATVPCKKGDTEQELIDKICAVDTVVFAVITD